MQDGIPRGAYRGTVQIAWNSGKARVFITPSQDFSPTTEKGIGVDRHGGATTHEAASLLCRMRSNLKLRGVTLLWGTARVLAFKRWRCRTMF
jgi:hypothetical protein